MPPGPDNADEESSRERNVRLLECWQEVSAPAGFFKAAAEQDDEHEDEADSDTLYLWLVPHRRRHSSVRSTPSIFFNFVFACVLYNVWRLVDLLVKVAIDGENRSYAPRVDANQFLTVAKQFYGLNPPD